MKRIIKAATSPNMDYYLKYYDVDDPDTWDMDQEEVDEIMSWYREACAKNGYTFDCLLIAKDPWYYNELDELGVDSPVAAIDKSGNVCLLDFVVQDHAKDITSKVRRILDTEIEKGDQV